MPVYFRVHVSHTAEVPLYVLYNIKENRLPRDQIPPNDRSDSRRQWADIH